MPEKPAMAAPTRAQPPRERPLPVAALRLAASQEELLQVLR